MTGLDEALAARWATGGRVVGVVVAVVASTACAREQTAQRATRPAPVAAAREAPALPVVMVKGTTISVPGARGTIVTLGDSITLGISNSAPAKTFPAQLAALAHMNVVNLGARNVLTGDVIAREVPQIPADANAVVLDVGTIDATAATTNAEPSAVAKNVKIFEPNFERLVLAVQNRAPHAKIVIVTVRDLGRAGAGSQQGRGAALSSAVREWNAHERAIAASNRIGAVVDTETDAQWYIAPEYDRGGIHPTDAGAARLAGAIAAALGG